MTLYLDTSNLVKLYVEEHDSAAVHADVAAADAVVTSVVAYAEARATFARRRRERLMTPAELKTVVRQFDDDWAQLIVMAIDDELGRAAGRLADAHGIRGFDAIHLATFEALMAHCPDDDVRFSCADHRLVKAARSLG